MPTTPTPTTTSAAPALSEYEELKARLAASNGPAYWRSLEELAETPEFRDQLANEFPSQEERWIDPFTRRNFLKLMGASMALAGLTGCNVQRHKEKILPYVKQPEDLVMGKALFYASAMPLAGYGYPVLVENHEGRPTKLEGNPDHPASLGAATVAMQSSILAMYDPDRSSVVTYLGTGKNYGDGISALKQALEAEKAKDGGAGIRILTETITSPTLLSQIEALLKAYPQARWVQYDLNGHDQELAGAALAFGEPAQAVYNFAAADVVLSLDADFMIEGAGALRYSRDFARRRRIHDPAKSAEVNRFYAIESMPTCSGTLADHRLPAKAGDVARLATALAAALGISGATAPTNLTADAQKFIATAAADLKAKGARALVLAGSHQPAAVHAMALAINQALGSIGTTVLPTAPVVTRVENHVAALKTLTDEMAAGKVSTLIVVGANLVYAAPADLKLKDALLKVPFRAHLGEYVDETAELCQWHLPLSHYLEAWGDIRSFDGTVTIQQPLILPLNRTKSAIEVFAAVLQQEAQEGYDIVLAGLKSRLGAGATAAAVDKTWRQALHDGYVANSAAAAKPGATVKASFAELAAAAPKGGEAGMEVAFRLDPNVYDGRLANQGWLQELPKPFTKLTWDNVAHVSPRTASKLGLSLKTNDTTQAQMISVSTAGGASMELPALIMPGHADDSITVHVGWGRTRAGRVGTNRGFNTHRLRTTAAPFIVAAQAKSAGKTFDVARTQLHFTLDDNDISLKVGGKELAVGQGISMYNRGLVRMANLDAYVKEPDFAKHVIGGHEPHEQESLYFGSWEYRGYAWGMAIDTSVCNGCNACITACQAENNISVVGKGEIARQHEMHWLRIDQYYTGDLDNPQVFNQPLPCMHCENAPCEVVCPVAATVHSDEGSNDMVYNRCVGTRFCSNNCPYKVRRFNWFNYNKEEFAGNMPLKRMFNNPDVTVRSRGVMEKCTYCVQRISSARIEAENDGRPVRDGEIMTACQATCPTEAIVFGNINDPESRVAKMKANSLNYALLAELQVKPRTTYMAIVRNQNAALAPAPAAAGHHHGHSHGAAEKKEHA